MTKTFLLAAVVLAMALQCALAAVVNVAGVKLDLTPAVVVFAALFASWNRALFAAVACGVLLDALSFQALGLSVAPLAVAAAVISHFQRVLYRDNILLQLALGGATSLALSVWTWLLLGLGATPLPFEFGIAAKMALIALLAALGTPPLLWLFKGAARWTGQWPGAKEVEVF
ncbi:MAG: rod shape-determining protein MreD [Verrucomicrobia bacterium]|nr:rod shape-determining protein MreD [Verrucomicrobiota bacterium]